MITKREGPKLTLMRVTFELPQSVVSTSVHIVGDCSDWSRHSHPLVRRDGGPWSIELVLERSRRYQFRYLIDGVTWQNDWHADSYVPNPFGGENSVIDT